jgi:hypothetical protein
MGCKALYADNARHQPHSSAFSLRLDSPSTRAWMSLMAAAARFLEEITTTHMYLLRSSTSSRKYLLPHGVASEIGLHKSSSTSSRRHSARYSTFIRNEVRRYFSAWHASHNCST